MTPLLLTQKHLLLGPHEPSPSVIVQHIHQGRWHVSSARNRQLLGIVGCNGRGRTSVVDATTQQLINGSLGLRAGRWSTLLRHGSNDVVKCTALAGCSRRRTRFAVPIAPIQRRNSLVSLLLTMLASNNALMKTSTRLLSFPRRCPLQKWKWKQVSLSACVPPAAEAAGGGSGARHPRLRRGPWSHHFAAAPPLGPGLRRASSPALRFSFWIAALSRRRPAV